MTDARTHYERLGIRRDASHEQIKVAFRERMRAAHPDLNPGSSDEAAYLNEAYDVLSDAQLRAAYDLTLPVDRPVRVAVPDETSGFVDRDPRAGMHAAGKEVPLPLVWLILLFASLLSVLAYGLWVNGG